MAEQDRTINNTIRRVQLIYQFSPPALSGFFEVVNFSCPARLQTVSVVVSRVYVNLLFVRRGKSRRKIINERCSADSSSQQVL